MKRIEKYIPVALNVLAKETVGIVRDNKIDKTYNGYISAFGASIISSGLLPTMIFYSKKAEGNENADRSLILVALEKMLKSDEIGFLSPEKTLLKEVIERHNEVRFKQKIQECAIALKLAIRTYPQTKND